jgi:hypothetical protein
MSLLSEDVATVINAQQAIDAENVITPSFPGKVSVTSAEYYPALQGGVSGTTYLVPLSFSIPQGAIVYKAFVEADVNMVSAGAATVALGLVGNGDVLAATAFDNVTYLVTNPNGATIINPTPLTAAAAAINYLRVTIAVANVTAGAFSVKVIFA